MRVKDHVLPLKNKVREIDRQSNLIIPEYKINCVIHIAYI